MMVRKTMRLGAKQPNAMVNIDLLGFSDISDSYQFYTDNSTSRRQISNLRKVQERRIRIRIILCDRKLLYAKRNFFKEEEEDERI